MSVISHSSPRRARFDPASAFPSPTALAHDVGLTRGQKLSALRDWAFAVERRIAAASEGMHTRGFAPSDLQLLDEILAAQARLRLPPEARKRS